MPVAKVISVEDVSNWNSSFDRQSNPLSSGTEAAKGFYIDPFERRELWSNQPALLQQAAEQEMQGWYQQVELIEPEYSTNNDPDYNFSYPYTGPINDCAGYSGTADRCSENMGNYPYFPSFGNPNDSDASPNLEQLGNSLGEIAGGSQLGPNTKIGSSPPPSVNETLADKVESSLGQIGSNGVQQGSYGDCFFESAVASMADTPDGQKALRQMIKPNESDDSVTVTFPGDKAHPVTVTQSDMKKYATSDSASWANVIETAFLKYDGYQHAGNDIPSSAKVTTPTDALHLLTGKDTTEDSIGNNVLLGGTSTADLQGDIEGALKNHNEITASSDLVPNGQGVNGSDSIYYPKDGSQWALVGDHQFSVVGYDAKTQTITLRNPWGSDGQGSAHLTKKGQTYEGITDEGNGLISMSLNTFTQHFSALDISGASGSTLDHMGRGVGNDIEHVGHNVMQWGTDALSWLP